MQPIKTQADPISACQNLLDQVDALSVTLAESVEGIESTVVLLDNHQAKLKRIKKEMKNNWLNRLIDAVCNFVKFIFSPIFMLFSYLGKKLNFSKAEVKSAEPRVEAIFDARVKGKT